MSPNSAESHEAPPPGAHATLVLSVESDRARYHTLYVTDECLIGRAEPGQEAELGLDLAPYQAVARGVSRQHAIIRYQDSALFVADRQSVSGTRLNGLTLAPDRDYRLREGDEIQIGWFRLVVLQIRLHDG